MVRLVPLAEDRAFVDGPRAVDVEHTGGTGDDIAVPGHRPREADHVVVGHVAFHRVAQPIDTGRVLSCGHRAAHAGASASSGRATSAVAMPAESGRVGTDVRRSGMAAVSFRARFGARPGSCAPGTAGIDHGTVLAVGHC